ncbi:hypothetical protein KL86CLO1_11629 [uncultured Eubacteriales bacterium]|uniref:Uncharacterized protein n=1 Tax=uncultured Eubacteriales bacterium TaxID=172733 RepID=A0A212JSK2_9FIRM|nr:hypothetical protein KL86CLO1_11629 [uncultured Eubacteriales bacterium]
MARVFAASIEHQAGLRGTCAGVCVPTCTTSQQVTGWGHGVAEKRVGVNSGGVGVFTQPNDTMQKDANNDAIWEKEAWYEPHSR